MGCFESCLKIFSTVQCHQIQFMASDKSNSIWFELAGSTSHESFMSPTCSACSPLRFINYSKSGGNIIYSERGNLSFPDNFLIFIFALFKLEHTWENPLYRMLLLLLTLVHGFFMSLFSLRVFWYLFSQFQSCSIQRNFEIHWYSSFFSNVFFLYLFHQFQSCSILEKLRGTLIFLSKPAYVFNGMAFRNRWSPHRCKTLFVTL